MRKSGEKAVTFALFSFVLITCVGRERAQAIHAPYQGFGTTTPGGSQGEVVRVANLNDSGPGSFREAVAQGNRTVVFDVAGEILLSDYVFVRGAFVTIDGFTAPPPGITLVNRGLIIRGTRGAHDVIVRGIRVRNSPIDGIQVSSGAYNVVIDHVSVSGSGDGNLDITESQDVTVSWSVLAAPTSGKNMLIKYRPERISLHHNMFVKALARNPQVSIDDAGTPALDTTLDMRNNLVWDWSTGFGTLIWYGARANIVNNFYSSAEGDKKNALTVCQGECNGGVLASFARASVSGNVSIDDLRWDINAEGNEANPFPAAWVDTVDACTSAHAVLATAGVRPLDAIDAQYLSAIVLPACVASTPGSSLPIAVPASSSR